MEQVLGRSSEDFLEEPNKGGRSLTTAERRVLDLSAQIRGWGSDLDPSVRPGVPMDKAPGIGVETLYPDFEHQVPRARVHKSTEHGMMPPVFGNVCPPRGLSGKIRDVAYGFSEGRLSHWLLLMLADRVDVVEEFFVDLSHFEIPNIPKEMGLKSELQLNRDAVVRKAVFVGAGALALFAIWQLRKR